ncbi:MAG TPA: hypothetical protein PKM35_05495 [Holophaga sp.]|jgi:hypothetical protein|nr:hypothetical protein [Holophaga sp.]HPS68016.1 hypothetical protein [Holophaga sp.]
MPSRSAEIQLLTAKGLGSSVANRHRNSTNPIVSAPIGWVVWFQGEDNSP